MFSFEDGETTKAFELIISAMKATWASLFEDLKSSDFDPSTILKKTLELSKDSSRLMDLYIRSDLESKGKINTTELKKFLNSPPTLFQPEIDLPSLIRWISSSYGEEAPSAYDKKISHFNTFLVFSIFSARKNLKQDPEFLKAFLETAIQQLIALTKLPKAEQSYKKVTPIFLRLQLAISQIIIYQEDKKNAPLELKNINQMLVTNSITDSSLWELGYHPDKIIAPLVIGLKQLGLLQDSQETLDLASRAAAVFSLGPNDLYNRLIQNPNQLITDGMITNPFGQNTKIGLFNQINYPELSECHCLPAFSRGPQDLRGKWEKLLVDAVSNIHKPSPKVAIIGSGNLLEVVIVCLKFSKKPGFQTLHLDLVDPCAFLHGFDKTLKSFVKLLSDLNFDLELCRTANKLYHGGRLNESKYFIPRKSESEPSRGKFVIDFHENRNISKDHPGRVFFKGYVTKQGPSNQNPNENNEGPYQGNPDVIGMCDVRLGFDLQAKELAISLDSALPKTHFIALKKIVVEGKKEYDAIIEHSEKNDDGSWKAIPVLQDQSPSFTPSFSASASSSSSSSSSHQCQVLNNNNSFSQ